jgi:hypothetical protein
LAGKPVDGRAAEREHALAREQQPRLAAVDVLAVRLEHHEDIDEVAGLNLVADAHDLVGLDGDGAFAFGDAHGEAGDELAFEQRRAFAQVEHRHTADGRRVLKGAGRIDRQALDAQARRPE